MKKNIYIFGKSKILLFATIGLMCSCSNDFLKEDMIRQESTQSFETKEGLDQLSVGMYANLRIPFTYGWAFPYWQIGTDEMTGGTGANEFNDYTDGLNSSTGDGSAENWDHMFAGIGSANTLIKNVPLYYDKNSADYNTRLGEGYFMRGYNYFRMVMQFGGLPLLTEPVESAQTDFTRSTTEETYDLIISDLKQAYELLPETNGGQLGRITKYAAAHFIAKACLFRASELYDDWNTPYKEQDLNDVIEYGKKVITAHPLCPNFVDLWDFQKPDGPNEYVSEVVLSAQFSDLSRGRTGNQLHMYFLSRYQNIPGILRDISGCPEYRRMRTTNYAQDVYDRVNDSRFWKSFITVYNCNNPKAAPKWKAPYTPTDKNEGDPKYVGNEAAALYIVNDAGDPRYTEENIQYRAPYIYVRYFAGEPQAYIGNNVNGAGAGVHGNYGNHDATATIRYLSLSKYRDGSRSTIGATAGQRDAIIARSAEDYLMIAEAYIRKDQYTEALPYINALRERAGYADGEDRSKHVDGGQAYLNNSSGSGLAGGATYSDKNTYYESNNDMEVTTTSTKNDLKFTSISEILNSKKDFYDILGANGDKDKLLIFIMNERSRELMGELIRWPDLARSKQLEKRYKTFNDGQFYPGSNFDPNKHYLRPIPQSFLDAVTKNGKALTSEEKQAMQNPGW